MIALILFGILAILVGGVFVRSISSYAENLSNPKTAGFTFFGTLIIVWLLWAGKHKPFESWENAVAMGPYFWIFTGVSLFFALIGFLSMAMKESADAEARGVFDSPESLAQERKKFLYFSIKMLAVFFVGANIYLWLTT